MRRRSARTPHVLLIPGAWMGGWIWEPTVQELRTRGIGADTVTLEGLGRDTSADRRGQIRLSDHVDQVTDLVTDSKRPVILVGHSYSGMVTAQVADRLRERVTTSIHLGSFLPVDGKSLIDDFGTEQSQREQERADIIDADYQWAPPPAEALESDAELTAEGRRHLLERFTPHPGRTVLDPASLQQPVETQSGIYVASADDGIPAVLQGPAARSWRTLALRSGHWPMIERPEDVAEFIARVVAVFGRHR